MPVAQPKKPPKISPQCNQLHKSSSCEILRVVSWKMKKIIKTLFLTGAATVHRGGHLRPLREHDLWPGAVVGPRPAAAASGPGRHRGFGRGPVQAGPGDRLHVRAHLRERHLQGLHNGEALPRAAKGNNFLKKKVRKKKTKRTGKAATKRGFKVWEKKLCQLCFVTNLC